MRKSFISLGCETSSQTPLCRCLFPTWEHRTFMVPIQLVFDLVGKVDMVQPYISRFRIKICKSGWLLGYSLVLDPCTERIQLPLNLRADKHIVSLQLSSIFDGFGRPLPIVPPECFDAANTECIVDCTDTCWRNTATDHHRGPVSSHGYYLS
jgi:hypothetical protein